MNLIHQLQVLVYCMSWQEFMCIAAAFSSYNLIQYDKCKFKTNRFKVLHCTLLLIFSQDYGSIELLRMLSFTLASKTLPKNIFHADPTIDLFAFQQKIHFTAPSHLDVYCISFMMAHVSMLAKELYSFSGLALFDDLSVCKIFGVSFLLFFCPISRYWQIGVPQRAGIGQQPK